MLTVDVTEQEFMILEAIREDELMRRRVLLACDLERGKLKPLALRLARAVALGHLSEDAAAAQLDDDAAVTMTADWKDAIDRFAEQAVIAARTTPEWGVVSERSAAADAQGKNDHEKASKHIAHAVKLADPGQA